MLLERISWCVARFSGRISRFVASSCHGMAWRSSPLWDVGIDGVCYKRVWDWNCQGLPTREVAYRILDILPKCRTSFDTSQCPVYAYIAFALFYSKRLAMPVAKWYHSSSLSSSIGASPSLLTSSFSSSSSLLLFWPAILLGLLASSIIWSSLALGGFNVNVVTGCVVVAAAEAEGVALKMLCCNSVDVTAPAAAEGLWNVPSSFAIVSDLDLAYCIS